MRVLRIRNGNFILTCNCAADVYVAIETVFPKVGGAVCAHAGELKAKA